MGWQLWTVVLANGGKCSPINWPLILFLVFIWCKNYYYYSFGLEVTVCCFVAL
uniref:Uncharacterized protein n=1 Tax=Rhizophora mucronata TaxID=61149 RepID=A0A2P2NAT8_RHIMU